MINEDFDSFGSVSFTITVSVMLKLKQDDQQIIRSSSRCRVYTNKPTVTKVGRRNQIRNNLRKLQEYVQKVTQKC